MKVPGLAQSCTRAEQWAEVCARVSSQEVRRLDIPGTWKQANAAQPEVVSGVVRMVRKSFLLCRISAQLCVGVEGRIRQREASAELCTMSLLLSSTTFRCKLQLCSFQHAEDAATLYEHVPVVSNNTLVNVTLVNVILVNVKLSHCPSRLVHLQCKNMQERCVPLRLQDLSS